MPSYFKLFRINGPQSRVVLLPVLVCFFLGVTLNAQTAPAQTPASPQATAPVLPPASKPSISLSPAVIMAKGNWIETSHLPPYIQNPVLEETPTFVLPAGVSAARAQKELILRTLKKAGNNKAEAARQLGLDVKTIVKKLKSYGVH